MSKTLVFVTATVLEIFYQELSTPASKSDTFLNLYSSRNILPRFCCKSPSFCHSYSTRNILPTFGVKSPSFGKSCSTRNILYINQKGARHCRKPLRNILTRCDKALLLVNPTELEIF